MKLKKSILVTGIAVMLMGNVMTASASVEKDVYQYTYVTKTKDYKSSFLEKKNPTDDATNLVAAVDGGKLCCWMEGSKGMRISSKESYDCDDPVYMTYTKDDIETARLVVSTVLTNFEKTGTFGYWSPDYITTY